MCSLHLRPEGSGAGLPPPRGVSEPRSCPPAHSFICLTVHLLVPPASLPFFHTCFYPLTNRLVSTYPASHPTAPSSCTMTYLFCTPHVHLLSHSLPLASGLCTCVTLPAHQSLHSGSLLGTQIRTGSPQVDHLHSCPETGKTVSGQHVCSFLLAKLPPWAGRRVW